MKIRLGFVSNSSTTTFCIYGAGVDESDVRKILIEKGIATQEGLDMYGIGEFFPDEAMGDLDCIVDYEGNYTYFGRYYYSIGENETGSQFKKDVEEKMKKFFGKEIECKTIEKTISS